MCAGRFGLGWAHDIFTFACHMFMHFFMHTYLQFSISWYWSCWCFSTCFFFSLFLSLVALWHLIGNLFRLRTFFVPRHLFLLPLLILLYITSGSMMIKPVRTFRRTSHDTTFIWNAKSFYRTFLILTFPLSSTVGVESHCVASQSPVLPWSYRSFTLTCMDSNILYLTLSLML